jgi:NTE family protein
LRAVDFVSRLIEAGRLEGTGYRRVLTHIIGDEAELSKLSGASKFDVEPELINDLFDHGRAAAEAWLKAHTRDLGVRSTANIRKLFQGDDDSLDGSQLTPPKQKLNPAKPD